MSITIRCPCCDATFQANIVVAHTAEVGARNNRKSASGNIEHMILDVIRGQPNQYTMSGRKGIWENRHELRDEIQLIGRDALHKALRRLIGNGALVKAHLTNGGALSVAKAHSA